MDDILCINTGGTFNKYYDPITGNLLVDKSSCTLDVISKKWQCKFETINIIGKDSLEFNDDDREMIIRTINDNKTIDKFIIIHGTDTMHLTAQYLHSNIKNKYIVLTGAMMPFSIDPIEATANFASSAGYLSSVKEFGVYISMNGLICEFDKIIKDRKMGRFIKNR